MRKKSVALAVAIFFALTAALSVPGSEEKVFRATTLYAMGENGDGESENPSGVGEGLVVVSTLPDIAGIVREICGGGVDIETVLPPGADPHGFSVTTETLESLRDADLIVYAYSSFLSFEQDIKDNFPDTPGLDFPDYEKKGASLDSFPGFEFCQHGYWLKLDNALAIGRAVAEKMGEIDPANATYYKTRAEAFAENVDHAKKALHDITAENNLLGKKVVTAVPGVNYVVENMGMEVGATLVSEESGFASGKQLMDVEKKLSDGEYVGIVCPLSMREGKAGEISEQVAKDTGARVVYVRFLAGENVDGFFSQVYFNAAQMALLSEENGVGGGENTYALIALGAVSAVALAEGAVIYRLRTRELLEVGLEEEKSGERGGEQDG